MLNPEARCFGYDRRASPVLWPCCQHSSLPLLRSVCALRDALADANHSNVYEAPMAPTGVGGPHPMTAASRLPGE